MSNAVAAANLHDYLYVAPADRGFRNLFAIPPGPIVRSVAVMVVWTGWADGLEDETLLAATGGGDRAAATVFLRRHQRAVYGLAITMRRDECVAEDLSQQTSNVCGNTPATSTRDSDRSEPGS